VAEDEAVALYGATKEMAEAMRAREMVLDAKIAALNSAIARTERIPALLEQQIGPAVRSAIREDFSKPIQDAVSGPIAELNRTTTAAKNAAEAMTKESRYQSWTWLFVAFILGILIGGLVAYSLVARDLDKISSQLETVESQTAPVAPSVGAGHKGSTHAH